MKRLTPNSLKLISAALGLGFCLLANHAWAALTTWDPQGTSTSNVNGSGFWTNDLSGTWESALWSTASQNGSSPTVAWVENTAAVFATRTGTGTPSFTVTMNANHIVAGIFDGSLTWNPCPVTIAGSGTYSNAPNNLNGINPTATTTLNVTEPGSPALAVGLIPFRLLGALE